MQNINDVKLAAQCLKAALPEYFNPQKAIGVILGTGLSEAFDADGPSAVAFARLPAFPESGVSSHAGSFILREVGSRQLLLQRGRCHIYEGRSPAEVCMGVRVMATLGIRDLIITNAAGALNPLFEAGSMMCMSDMINFTGQSPLSGKNCESWGERFPDMSRPFDPELQKLAMSCALKLGLRLERGVYIGVHGPEMETPAETRMYRRLGADAIGMSTVLEVIAARHMGMRALGFSCLTNKNLPDCMEAAPLEKVIGVARKAGEDLALLIHELLTVWPQGSCA